MSVLVRQPHGFEGRGVVDEIRSSEPPFVLLLLAFVAAWGLSIDFLINLPT